MPKAGSASRVHALPSSRSTSGGCYITLDCSRLRAVRTPPRLLACAPAIGWN